MADSSGIARIPGEDGDHVTYCRICEALCGMVATVKDGRITKIRPDRDNPHSRGHICVKGPALADLAYDEDRVLHPLKRVGGPGEFEPVGWDEALDDIAKRLAASVERHGAFSFAVNSGNPPSMGWPSSLASVLFQQAMGGSRTYTPASEDISTPVLATELMFGTHAFVFPDLATCEHLLIFGSNPLVSHGSLMIAPRFKEDLDEIAKRGRVIVVDPRRTETARKFEHVSILPEGDVWLLGAMLQVILSEDLQQRQFIEQHCAGLEGLVAATSWITPMLAEPRCGIDAETIQQLARDFASAPRAAAMGRIGICRGGFSTLTNFFLHALNVIGGKFHTPGGVGWGHGGSATDEQFAGIFPGARHGAIPSRVSKLPSVWGTQPSTTFLEEMITPGEGQIKSLLVVGANPVMSMPGGPALVEGFAELDLMVALDLYMTETSRHAHYLLPVTTALEREDMNQFFLNHMVRPFAQYVPAVIKPVGETRGEYEILRDLAVRMGRGESFGNMTPFEMADASLQKGIEGQKGLSLAKLKEHPHGIMIESGRWAFDFKKRLGHEDGTIHLWCEEMQAEVERLRAKPARKPDVLQLINLRKLRSINSWMHNVEALVRTDAPKLLIHPTDAAARGLNDEDEAKLSTQWGSLDVVVSLTDDIRPGCVAYPHGWGNHGGWKRANAKGGGNLNAIVPQGPQSAEQLSGMSYLEGFEVEVSAA
ncbi:formate dehydrogenase [Sphingorhabdus pulchriflava]|uniref:Formate dehydrogenase n=1 Tax=Sphingorhabdus pulchriflava TaxID=2292257 RepID=A0A371BFN4_9SPHN|nr:molybdopterin-dependent oxidoreductase [Sphingorhabdus pulchriflava]RDV06317.1 formate dehydrogenase [Sphingorhabdus pulchriflava]